MNSQISKKTIIFDSNVWISFFFENDERHFESQKLIGKNKKQQVRIYVPSIIIIEIIAVLNRNNLPKGSILLILKEIINFPNISIIELNHETLVEAASNLLGKIKLKAQDFTIFIYHVNLRNERIITYDAEFNKQIKLYEKKYCQKTYR